MKNIQKKFALFTSTVLIGFSLISCGGEDPSDDLIHLDYGNIHLNNISSISEIPEQTYDSLTSSILNTESFMLMTYNDVSGCSDCWTTFSSVLVEFVNTYHIDVKYIGVSAFEGKTEKYDLHLDPGNMPSIAFFKRGKLIRQTIYVSNDDPKIFRSYKTFVEHLKKNVVFPNIYYLDKDVLDKYIEEGKEFNIYFNRNGCGDCKRINKTVLQKWVDKTTTVSKDNILYAFDLEEYRVNMVNYCGLKDKYGLSIKYNPVLGYPPSEPHEDYDNGGAVPTFQHRKGNTIKDMIVVYNDIIVDGKLSSYFSSTRVAAMPFLKNAGDIYVLDGRTLTQEEIDSKRAGVNSKYHDPIANLFLNTYVK